MRREAWQHADAMQWPERRARRVDSHRHPHVSNQQICAFPHRAECRRATLRRSINCARASIWAGSIETVDSHVIERIAGRVAGRQGCCLWQFGAVVPRRNPIWFASICSPIFRSRLRQVRGLACSVLVGWSIPVCSRGVVIDRPLHIGSMHVRWRDRHDTYVGRFG